MCINVQSAFFFSLQLCPQLLVMYIEISSCLKVFSSVSLHFFNFFFNNSLCLFLGLSLALWSNSMWFHTSLYVSSHLAAAKFSALCKYILCSLPSRLCLRSAAFALQVNQFEFIFALVSNLVKTVSVCSANFPNWTFVLPKQTRLLGGRVVGLSL